MVINIGMLAGILTVPPNTLNTPPYIVNIHLKASWFLSINSLLYSTSSNIIALIIAQLID